MAIWGKVAIKVALLILSLLLHAAWIFYIVILFVLLILIAGVIIAMVFNDSIKIFVLGIIYSLL